MHGLNYEKHSLIKKNERSKPNIKNLNAKYFLLLNGNFLLKFIFHFRLYFLDYDIHKKTRTITLYITC